MLSQNDLFCIARFQSGLDWQQYNPTPMIAGMLANIKSDLDKMAFFRMLGTETQQRVLQLDPLVLPAPKRNEAAQARIPALPQAAQIDPAQIKRPAFVDEFMRWSIKRSPMTPASFLEAGVLFAVAAAIAGRIRLPIYKPIASNLYCLWIARTSVFKKSTGMEAVADLLAAAVPHLILPQELTPESFVATLAGKLPSNFDSLTSHQKKLLEAGRKFCAQRVIVIDEASSLLGAEKRDYMRGQEELLLRAFDASSQPYRRYTNSEGFVEIRNLTLSILGATTPAAMVRNLRADDWETGKMARYALLYPDARLPYALPNLKNEEYIVPSKLVKHLATLHTKLPIPPEPALSGDENPPAFPTIDALISKEAFDTYERYVKALTFDLLQDNNESRIDGNYSRLPELAIKVAILSAALNWDWNTQPSPRIEIGDWCYAQHIAETWRASLHRLLVDIDAGEDARNENKLLNHLLEHPEGESMRELVNRTGMQRKTIRESLESLEESGLVMKGERKAARGPAATVYISV